MNFKIITIISLFFIILTSGTCEKREETKKKIMHKTWLHSHEEDEGEIMVYRPNTFNFPPSRGRTGFSMEENGAFKYYDIAPADGLVEKKGRWKLVKKKIYEINFDKKEKQDFQIEVIQADENMLKIKRRFLQQ